MTNQYLLAAEAAKIQDFVFRAAHLREVVGGSQLLARFCAEAPGPLGVTHRSDLVVHAGGSFRILFPSEDAARRFGGHLAELYRLAADGTLTVADPIPVTGDYGDAAAAAEEALRRAKRRRAGAETSPHLPIIAFCTNCGAGLATAHKLRHAKDETPQYLCAACQAKAAERAGERRAGLFLGSFYAAVAGIELDPENGAKEALDAADLLQWPGRTPRLDGGEHDPVEDVADYDDRRYVAYLVADGNNLGEIFGLCRTAEEVSTLSTSLDAIVRRALAAPTKLAMRQEVRPGRHAPHALVPVLPLILGGDDVFVLLPAPWALDFALRFCREYEQQMAELLRGPKFAGLRRANSRSLDLLQLGEVIAWVLSDGR